MKPEVILSLSKDEALILFDFLSRFSEKDILKIEDQAEERVLWNLYCDLEKKLVESFQENYRKLLLKARNNIRDKNE